MANAMLDARREGDPYRRVEVITGQRRRPLLGPPRNGCETEDFLRNACLDIPAAVEALRQYWMPIPLRTRGTRPRSVRASRKCGYFVVCLPARCFSETLAGHARARPRFGHRHGCQIGFDVASRSQAVVEPSVA